MARIQDETTARGRTALIIPFLSPVMTVVLAAALILAVTWATESWAADKVLVSGTVVALGNQVYIRDDMGGDYLVAAPDLTLHKGKAIAGRGMLEKKDNGERVLTLTSFEVIAPDSEECATPEGSLPGGDGGPTKAKAQ